MESNDDMQELQYLLSPEMRRAPRRAHGIYDTSAYFAND